MMDLTDLTTPERVEQHRRSIAMLPPGSPALNREQAIAVLEQLGTVLRQLRAR